MVAHPVLLRGAGAGARVAGPLLLRRTDDDVVATMLDELADRGGLASVLGTRATPTDGSATLTLMQPVHRVFHVALLEIVCDQVGTPRLDPARIESAGLVLRRQAVDERGQPLAGVLEGWMQEAPTPKSRAAGAPRKRQMRGWVRFGGRAGVPRTDLDQDPEPPRRRPPPALRSGHPEIDLRLVLGRGASEALAERVVPLFPAPPEVCVATGRTLLYGLIPVTSSEQSEAPEERPPYDRDELAAHMPQLLRAGLAPAIPKPGDFLAFAETTVPVVPDDIALFVRQLRQVAIEMDAFGESPEAKALLAAIDAIELVSLDPTTWPPGTTAAALAQMTLIEQTNRLLGTDLELPGLVRRTAGEFLREAVRVLVEADDVGGVVRMPIRWPSVSAEQAGRIVDAAQGAMAARLKAVVTRTPQFGDPTRLYQVRAFVRVRDDDGNCPPALVWSDYSEPFTIAPWYAPAEATALIPLPDLNRDALKKLKPNVSFLVPQKLADFLNGNDPKALAKGEGGAGIPGIALDWICSFNIPVITICAFIVLNIFLSLFDLVFRWMLFIKLCIPIPRRS